MASTGFTLPGTGANATGVGTEAWVTPGNVTADDGALTQGAPAKDEQMNYLVASNFGFSIPAGATIDGIEARVQAADASPDGSPAHITHAIIGKDNSTLGSDLEIGNTDVTSTLTNYTYGSSSELWGLTWTPAEINASTFQFRISMNADGSIGAGDPVVDAMWVNVHYTLATDGEADITEAADTVSSTGALPLKATASITEANDTLSAAGTISLSGTVSITEGNDTLSAAGAVSIVGTASITEGQDTSAATGALLLQGVLGATEADDTLVADSTIHNNDRTGELDVTEEDDTLQASLGILLTGGMIWTAAEAQHEDRRRRRLKKLLRETIQKVPEHEVRSPFPDPYRNGDPHQNLKRNRFPEPRQRKAKSVVVIDPIAEAERMQALVQAEVVRQLEAEIVSLLAAEQTVIQRRRRQEEELLLTLW